MAHNCGLDAGGSLYCWGSDEFGESTPPTGTYTAVTVGGQHSCAIDSFQMATCWGRNQKEQTTVAPGQYTSISGGRAHTCAVNLQQAVVCWGENAAGQSTPPVTGSSFPVDTGEADTGGWIK